MLRRSGLWQGSLLGSECDLKPIGTEQAFDLKVEMNAHCCFSSVALLSVSPRIRLYVSQGVTAVVLLMDACLMWSSTAARDEGGAVLAAGKTLLVLTVSSAEKTTSDHQHCSPAKTVTVMHWVSYTCILKEPVVQQSRHTCRHIL